jgi:phosphoribosylformylglycinamidine synthase subunit PurL
MEKNEVNLQDALEHGLRAEEFEEIQKILGRLPNSTELGIFSGMWSEHCSYKNSILWLKTLPSESELLLTKTGEENAGALDIGDGLGVVFKIESHNHPTAIEPYQGAATGVGGIMRDIFTMGARPFLSLNSLRFGLPSVQRNKYLLKRAVKGIADYGNSLGIAVGGGELFFDSSFSKNPLVNAMTVGLVSKNNMAKATTGGAIGNAVFIVGATTGRDGIHGASFASKDLTKESESKKSAVQVGDPFMEKLLMEATLEVIEKDLIIGIQDMGAAGISCSTSEMSAKGNTGMEINLDLVPFRETDMNAYEAMLSESQERMLVIPKLGKEKELVAIFEKWDLHAVEIGKVTEGELLKIYKDGKLKAEIPSKSLVLGGGAPKYKREIKTPKYLEQVNSFDKKSIPDLEQKSIFTVLKTLMSSLNIASRKPLFEQYDTDIGLVKTIGPGLDGGLARIPGTNKGIAVSTDCNSRYTYLNPYQGAIFAVCESARNVVVTGATPIGITNNLNFANPYIPENYFVFTECVKGIADSCRFLKLPVTGGNVSFYNESPEGPVFPTPTIGMVGLIQNIENRIENYFAKPGLKIGLIGKFNPTLGGSEYLNTIYKKQEGPMPSLDLEDEKNLISSILELNKSNLIHSAKDLSLGGLFVAMVKQTFTKQIGFQFAIENLPKEYRLDETLFGETAASILITYDEKNRDAIQKLIQKNQLEFISVGETIADFKIQIKSEEFTLSELKNDYNKALNFIFEE